MSDSIPLPDSAPVDLEVLRPFRADYDELQGPEEKKVLLRAKDLLTAHQGKLHRVFNAIGLEGRFVMPLDDQMVIQIEWVSHDVMLDGQTILMRVAADPPGLTPKAVAALRNRLRARYSVFRLNQLVPELGAEFEDLIFGGRFAVLDLPIAENRKPGDLVATRIYWTGEYWTHSSGRFFPRPELLPLVRRRVEPIVGNSAYDDLPPNVRSQVTTEIIRTCAEDMAAKDLLDLPWGVLGKYKEQLPPGLRRRPGAPAGDYPGPPSETTRIGRATRVGRNDPCPCGSGKKYKHCCGNDRPGN